MMLSAVRGQESRLWNWRTNERARPGRASGVTRIMSPNRCRGAKAVVRHWISVGSGSQGLSTKSGSERVALPRGRRGRRIDGRWRPDAGPKGTASTVDTVFILSLLRIRLRYAASTFEPTHLPAWRIDLVPPLVVLAHLSGNVARILDRLVGSLSPGMGPHRGLRTGIASDRGRGTRDSAISPK